MNITKNTETKYITFKVNGISFALNYLYIDSISKVENLVSVPNSEKSVDGILSYREATLTVVNLGEYLYNNKMNIDEHNLIIICHVGDNRLALRISEIEHIISVNYNELIPVDKMLISTSTVIDGYITDENGRIIQILDLKNIVRNISI